MMREFRAGKSLFPLLLWAALASLVLLVLWHSGLRHPVRLPLFAALLLLGPVAAGVHALRCWAGRVVLVPDTGLIFRGGRSLPWRSIRSVEHRPAAGDRDAAPKLLTSTDWIDHAPAQAGGAVFAALALQVLGVAVWFLLLPAFALLARRHARVTLILRKGDPLILSDLEEDAEFVRLVRIGITGRRDSLPRLQEACGRPPW